PENLRPAASSVACKTTQGRSEFDSSGADEGPWPQEGFIHRRSSATRVAGFRFSAVPRAPVESAEAELLRHVLSIRRFRRTLEFGVRRHARRDRIHDRLRPTAARTIPEKPAWLLRRDLHQQTPQFENSKTDSGSPPGLV